jgi:DNA-binding PadR family transcriptional regulator
MQKVGEISKNRVQLGPGTLYGALSNLQALGLIESVEDIGHERRKLYNMTELGLKVAEHEVNRFEELARHGRLLLGL